MNRDMVKFSKKQGKLGSWKLGSCLVTRSRKFLISDITPIRKCRESWFFCAFARNDPYSELAPLAAVVFVCVKKNAHHTKVHPRLQAGLEQAVRAEGSSVAALAYGSTGQCSFPFFSSFSWGFGLIFLLIIVFQIGFDAVSARLRTMSIPSSIDDSHTYVVFLPCDGSVCGRARYVFFFCIAGRKDKAWEQDKRSYVVNIWYRASGSRQTLFYPEHIKHAHNVRQHCTPFYPVQR